MGVSVILGASAKLDTSATSLTNILTKLYSAIASRRCGGIRASAKRYSTTETHTTARRLPAYLTLLTLLTLPATAIAQSFLGASVEQQRYYSGVEIEPLVLPEGFGFGGVVSYGLEPAEEIPAGLSFDAGSHTLTGTPEAVGSALTAELTYTASDFGYPAGDTSRIPLTVTLVIEPAPPAASDNPGAVFAIVGPHTVGPPMGVTNTSTITYTVALNAQPSGDVTAVISALKDFSTVPGLVLTPAGLTFTADNWDVPQRVSAVIPTAREFLSNVDTGTFVFSHALNIGGRVLTTSPASVLITLRALATAVVTPTTLRVDEGGAGFYTVALRHVSVVDNIPVTITPRSSDPGVVGVSAPLLFTSANWDIPQTVTVSGGRDADAADNVALITNTLTSLATVGYYTGVTPEPVLVTVTDTGAQSADTLFFLHPPGEQIYTAGVAVSTPLPQAGGGGGSPFSYTLTPSADIPAGLSFSEFRLTLSGTPALASSARTTTLTYTATDAGGASVSEPLVVVVAPPPVTDSPILDIERRAQTSNNLAPHFQTLRLTAPPSADTTVSITAQLDFATTPRLSVTPAELTFTAANWAVPQTFTTTLAPANEGIIGSADAGQVLLRYAVRVGERTVTTRIRFNGALVSGARSTFFFARSPEVVLLPSALTVAEGGSAFYTVVLRHLLPSNGMITVTPRAVHPLGVSTDGALTFTFANWNVPQTVSVTAGFDADTLDDTLVIANAVIVNSVQESFQGLTAPPLTVTITDTVTQADIPTFATPVPEQTYPSGARITPLTLPEASGGIGALEYALEPASAIPPGLTFTPATRVLSGAPSGGGVVATLAYIARDAGAPGVAGVTEVVVFVPPALTVEFPTDPIIGGDGGGAENTFRIRLLAEPADEVTVASTMAFNFTEPLPANFRYGPASLTFTPANWNVHQTVTARIFEAVQANAGSYFLTATSSMGGRTGVVHETRFYRFTFRPPPSFADDFSVAERVFQPHAPITPVTLPAGSVGGMTVSELTYSLEPAAAIPPGLTFDPATRVLSGTPTGGAVAATLAYVATDNRDNLGMRGTAPAPVVLVIAPIFSFKYTALFKHERVLNDVANEIALSLSAEPAEEVTVAVVGNFNFVEPLPANVRLGPASLTFTPANWNVRQRVTFALNSPFIQGNAGQHFVALTPSIAGRPGETIRNRYFIIQAHRAVPSVASLSLDEGETGFYTVVLEPRQPAAGEMVTVTPTSADSGAVAVSGPLVFTAADWNIPKTVTVTAVVDTDYNDEGPLSITHPLTPTVGPNDEYHQVNISTTYDLPVLASVTEPPVVAFIGDRDRRVREGETLLVPIGIRGATRRFSSGINFSIGGTATTADYEVTTQSAPSGNRILFNPATATGTIELYSAQTGRNLPIRLLDDGMDDDDETLVVTLTTHIGGAGPRHTIDATARTYTIDDDRVFLPVTTLAVTEGEGTTYTMLLGSAPDDGSVTITPATEHDGVTLSGALTFTADDWNVAQTVTVSTATDLDAADEVATLTHALVGQGNYAGAGAPDVLLNLIDPDMPGITFDPPSVTANEGPPGAVYTVALDSLPSAGEVTVSNTETQPSALTFNADNWNVAQTLTLLHARDADADDDTISAAHAISGAAEYAGLAAAELRATFTDLDTRGVSIAPAELPVAEGESANYTAVLDAQPSAGSVTVVASGEDAAVATLDRTTLTFTPTDWNVAQTIVVTGVEDIDSADETLTITHAVSADMDGDYDTVTAAAVTVTVRDDDAPGFDVSIEALTATEGVTTTYTVALATEPSGAVEVRLTEFNATSLGVRILPGNLTFSAADWNVSQTVGVTAFPDFDSADERATIVHAATGGGYDGVFLRLPAEISDDDTPGVTVSATRLTVGEGVSGDDGATYSVVLETQDGGTVVVTPGLSPSDHDLTLSRDGAPLTSSGALTFTDANWNVAQTVSIAAAVDADDNTDNARISHAVSGYGEVTSAGVVRVAVAEPVTVGFERTDYGFTEGELSGLGANAVEMCAVVSAPPPAGDIEGEVWFTVDTADGTATAPDDYAGLSGFFFGPIKDNLRRSCFSVTIPDDGLEESDETFTVTLSLNRQSTTAVNPTLSPTAATVTLTDNDVAGVFVSRTRLDLNEGGVAQNYTVALGTTPGAGEVVTVTPTLTPASGHGISLSPSGVLTFTAADWNAAQTVTVAAANDADALSSIATITHAVTGYPGFPTAADVTVAVQDSAAPGVVVSVATLAVDEGGDDAYEVVLNTPPSGDVTVTPSVTPPEHDLTLAPSGGALTFTTANWNTAQTVSVSAAMDADAFDDSATIRHAVAGYGTVTTAAAVRIRIADPDTPGVTVSTDTVSVTEGGAATDEVYTVVLQTQPAGLVTIVPISGDNDIAIPAPASGLTFSPANWDTPQTFAVTGTHDNDVADNSINIRHVVFNYAGVTGLDVDAVRAVVADDDEPGVSISATALTVCEDAGGALCPAGAGASAAYTVALTFPPNVGDVTVTVTPSGNQVTVMPSAADPLIFTDLNWSEPQAVRVTAAGTDADAADETVTLAHAVAGRGHYAGVTAAEVVATVADGDSNGVTVSPTALQVGEGGAGGEAHYTLRLTAQPVAGSVTVAARSEDAALATLDRGAVTFTTADWNVAQTVTVSGVEDLDAFDETLTITHAVSADSDDDYNTVTAAGVTVTVRDNDTPGFDISVDALTVAEGGSEAYTLRLTTMPNADVRVSITGFNAESIELVGELTFTAANWSEPQTISVSAATDFDGNDEHPRINHRASGGGYGSARVSQIAVTVLDPNVPGVTVSAERLMLGEGGGGGGSYTVVLDTSPADGTVVVTPSPMPADHDLTVAALPPATSGLTFTGADWNVAQTVTVTAAVDADDTTDTAIINHAVSGYRDITSADSVRVTVAERITLGFERADYAFTEGVTSALGLHAVEMCVVASLPPASGEIVGEVWLSVDTADGTATDPADYTGLSGFAVGPIKDSQRRACFSVAIPDDGLVEVSETFTATLTVNGATTTAVNPTLATATATVTLADNDVAGVHISQTRLNLNEGGAARQYTVALGTTPGAGEVVTVTPALAPASGHGVSLTPGGALTFTADDWNAAQTVTVSAADDSDALSSTVTITHAVSGYGGVTAADVTLLVLDDDAPGVAVSVATLDVDEGAAADYIVALNTAPSGTVTVTPSVAPPGHDLTLTPSGALTFTTANWNTAQTVSVRAATDADAFDDSATISHAVAGYGMVTTAAAVRIRIADPDTPGVTVSTDAVSVTEGGAATDEVYTVALQTQPAGAVTIVAVSDDNDIAAAAPADGLTFSPGNWDTPQAVTVLGAHDINTEDTSIVIRHLVFNYAGVSGLDVDTVRAVVADDDEPGVSILPLALTVCEDGGGGSCPAGAGASAAYSVALDFPPAVGDVTITVPADGNGVTLMTAMPTRALVFTADDWDVRRTVRVTAASDADAEDETVTLTHVLAGQAEYDGVTADDVVATVLDDDTNGVMASPSALQADEGAATHYTLRLVTQPVGGDVTVTPSGAPIDHDLTLEPAALTFTAADWNVAQTVSVSAGEDGDPDDDTATISHAVGGANYDGADVSAAVVGVVITDDDIPAVNISRLALTVVEGSDTAYAIALATLPTGDVVLTPSIVPDGHDLTLTPSGALTFTADDWDTLQTVTVAAAADADDFDDFATLLHTVTGYDDVEAEPIAVTISDPEDYMPTFPAGTTPDAQTYTVGIGITPVTLPLASGGSGTLTYTLTPEVASALPGLSFDIETRVLSGIPSAVAAPLTLTFTATDSDVVDPDTAALSFAVTVEIAPGGVLMPEALAVTEGAAVASGFTIRLAGSPGGSDVITATPTVTPASHGLTLTPAGALSFAAADWNTPQAVSVLAATDDDLAAREATITYTLTSGESNPVYAGITAALTVSVANIERGSLVISTAALSLSEGGAADAYGIRLGKRPATGMVTVTPIGGRSASGSGEVGLSPAALVFTRANWNSAQNVSVTAQHDDDVADGVVTVSHRLTAGAESGYLSADAVNDFVSVAVADDDAPAIALNPPAGLSAREGFATSYTVALQFQPSGGDVTVAVREQPDEPALTLMPATLTFSPANWATPQAVTVRAAEDADAIDEAAVSVVHVASGADYDGPPPVVARLPIGITDKDTAAVVVSQRTVAVREGGAFAYTVRLSSSPGMDAGAMATVTAQAAASDLRVTPAALTFSADNWAEEQTVAVTVLQDDKDDDETVTIRHSALGYGGLVGGVDDVVVEISDDDERGLVFTPGTRLAVDEIVTATYTIALATEPDEEVMIALSTSPPGNDLTLIHAGVLTFTPANWGGAQVVSVYANEDDDPDHESATIAHAVSGYGRITAGSVVVDINDTVAALAFVAGDDVTVDAQTYTRGEAVAVTLPAALGGEGALNFVLAPAVNAAVPGLAFDAATQVLSGAPSTVAGAVALTYAITDEENTRIALTFTVTVLPMHAITLPDMATGPLIVPLGDSVTYAVALNRWPHTDVVLELSVPLRAGETVSHLTLSAERLIFTQSNWSVRQSVTATPQVGAVGDYRITHRVTSGEFPAPIGDVMVRVRLPGRALDGVNQVILPELTRAMSDQQIGAIARRVAQARADAVAGGGGGGSGSGLRASLGGQSSLAALAATQMQALADGGVDAKQLLGGAEFVLPLNVGSGAGGGEHPGVSMWGGGDYRELGGKSESETVEWDGSLVSANVGVDAHLRGGLLGGVMVSWSDADLTYTDDTNISQERGDYLLEMASIHPYIATSTPGGWLDWWATLGYGNGEVEISNEGHDTRASSDITLQTAGAGINGRLLSRNEGELRLKAEAFSTRTEVEGGDEPAAAGAARLSELQTRVSRLRVAIQANKPTTTAGGARLEPSLEVGYRHDGGDGITGGGIELGAALNYQNPARNLTLALHTRALISDNDQKEFAIGTNLRLTPGPDHQGLSLSLTPTYGNTTANPEKIWQTGSPATAPADHQPHLNATIAYGFPALTPYGEMTLGKGDKNYRVGLRWGLGGSFDLNLAGEREEKVDDEVRHAIWLKGEVRF